MFKHADKTSDTARTRVRIAVQTNDIFRAVNIAADKRKRFRVARRGRFDKIADRTSFRSFPQNFLSAVSVLPRTQAKNFSPYSSQSS